MKLVIVLLLLVCINNANVCFFRQNIFCQNIDNCDLKCLSKLHNATYQSQTMQGVWQKVRFVMGGSWTIVQTPSSNWYSNWGIAAVCTCDQYDTIFIQQ